MQILEQARASSSAPNGIGTRTRRVSGAPRGVVAVGSGRVPGRPPEPEAPPGLTCPGLDDTLTEGQRAQAANTRAAGNGSRGARPAIWAKSRGVTRTCRRWRAGTFVMGHGVPPEPPCQSLTPLNLRWTLMENGVPVDVGKMRSHRKEGGPIRRAWRPDKRGASGHRHARGRGAWHWPVCDAAASRGARGRREATGQHIHVA